MKKIMSSILVFALGTPANASEVWVATSEPTTSEHLQELVERLRSQIKDVDFESSFERLVNHPANGAQLSILLDLDSVARAASLNGSFKEAYKSYLSLDQKLEALPAVAGLDKLTLSTRINLAHMASMLKKASAEELWKDAHAWSPTSVLSPEEFSPMVILRFSKPLSIGKKGVVEVNSAPEATVYLDGQKLSSNKVKIESGRHQVAAIAPGFAWGFKNFVLKDHQKTLKINIQPQPFAKGNCDNPEIENSEIMPKVKLLVNYGDDCNRVFFKNAWYSMDGSKFISSGVKTDLADSLKPSGEIAASNEMAAPSKQSFLTGLLKSGWFWAGVGVVAISAVVISSNQTTTVPTHTTQ